MKSLRFVRITVLGLALVVAAFGASLIVSKSAGAPTAALDHGVPHPTLLSGPVVYDPMNIQAELDDFELELKTRGNFTGRTVHFHFAPGASTGWHLHPGPAFVMVTAGTVSLYRNPGSPDGVFGAGQGWIEPPGQVHMAVNEWTEDAELVAFVLIPEGLPVTIPQPAPQN